MGILQRVFGNRRAKVDPARLGRGLAEMAADAVRPDLLEILIEGLPQKTLGHAFLAMASLNLFAWIRASQNEPLRLGTPASRKQIYDNMASFLVVTHLQLFDPDANPDATVVLITSKAVELMTVWNDSQEKSPSPHWYVAKEVWFTLEETRENPDPARINLLSGLFSTQTTTFLEFARRLEVSE